MTALTRRSFITSGAAAVASGITIGVPQGNNTPALSSQQSQVRVSGVTDTSKRPNSSHLGNNYVDFTVSPKSNKPIKEFEFYFEMDSKMFDVTGVMGIGAYLNLYFFTDKDMGTRDAKRIEIQPWDGTLADASYIDPTKPSQNSNWTVESIIDTEGSYVGMGNPDAQTGLVRVHAVQKPGGYEIEFSWTYTGEDYASDGTIEQVNIPQSAKYLLPIPNIYGLVASVRDSRDFRGDEKFTSFFQYGPTIHHLNQVRSIIAFTRLDTGDGVEFEPCTCKVEKSGSIQEVILNLGNEKRPDEQQELHLLMVEPNAHNVGFERGIRVGPYGQGEYERIEIIGADNYPIQPYVLTFEDGLGHIPTAIKRISKTFSQPFAATSELGTMDAARDFAETVAVVRSTRELTWVAPTINGLTRCADILDAARLVEAQRDRFPEISFGGENGRFTPIELFTGCNDLKALEMWIYQEHTTGTGNEKRYFVDAEVKILGDDIYSGRIYLPKEFDLSKPIRGSFGNYSRDLGYVREPYPVINPTVPVLCLPPPQSIV